jgi:hypothetical protein
MHRQAAIVIAFAAAGATAAAAAVPSDPEALRLMQLCRVASGGNALDLPEAFRETGTIAQDNGPPGPYETFGDLHALRSASRRTVDGKVRSAGFDGSLPWYADGDGGTATATAPPILRGERLGTWLTLSGYLHPDRFPASFRYLGRRQLRGRSYDIVLATPTDADSAQLWLDRATHRLAHIDSSTEGDRIVGDASDYRLVSGTWVAFALDINQAGHLTHLRIGTFTYIPLSQAHLTPPAGA